MGRIIKLLLVLGIIGFLALTAFAFLGVKAPQPQPVTKPAVLQGD